MLVVMKPDATDEEVKGVLDASRKRTSKATSRPARSAS